MIETKFSRFLRAGGHGECLLSDHHGRHIFMLGRKNGFPGYEDLRHAFENNLDRADLINRDLLTSAKTLDTRAWGYVDRPSRIYGQLRRYIDQIDRFNGSSNYKSLINPTTISGRRLELAVPRETSPEQITQIQRAIEYAQSRGIEVTVSFIE